MELDNETEDRNMKTEYLGYNVLETGEVEVREFERYVDAGMARAQCGHLGVRIHEASNSHYTLHLLGTRFMDVFCTDGLFHHSDA